MPQAKIIVGSLTLVALLGAGAWSLQLYSVRDPWLPYTHAVRGYLAAALQHDSAALARHSGAPQPITWVQDATHQRPAVVAAWAQQLKVVTGFRAGETVTVALEAPADGCSPLNTVTVQLLNHSAAPRLLAVSSPCMRADMPPLLPYQQLW